MMDYPHDNTLLSSTAQGRSSRSSWSSWREALSSASCIRPGMCVCVSAYVLCTQNEFID